ncbi:MAG: hypothetical protein IT310_08880 [Anaerolineales bacterium]|nr:hypothetical protein [Anaerolineales bacterium]
MTIEYDDKGKFFTDVVTKTAIPSILQTTAHLIRGKLHVRQGERLKSELENGENFVAITDATVYDHAGQAVFSGPFLAVRRDQIVWVMPVDQDANRDTEG